MRSGVRLLALSLFSRVLVLSFHVRRFRCTLPRGGGGMCGSGGSEATRKQKQQRSGDGQQDDVQALEGVFSFSAWKWAASFSLRNTFLFFLLLIRCVPPLSSSFAHTRVHRRAWACLSAVLYAGLHTVSAPLAFASTDDEVPAAHTQWHINGTLAHNAPVQHPAMETLHPALFLLLRFVARSGEGREQAAP